MMLAVPLSLQRLLWLDLPAVELSWPRRDPVEGASGRASPVAIEADFLDTRPVVFRSEAFCEDLLDYAEGEA